MSQCEQVYGAALLTLGRGPRGGAAAAGPSAAAPLGQGAVAHSPGPRQRVKRTKNMAEVIKGTLARDGVHCQLLKYDFPRGQAEANMAVLHFDAELQICLKRTEGGGVVYFFQRAGDPTSVIHGDAIIAELEERVPERTDRRHKKQLSGTHAGPAARRVLTLADSGERVDDVIRQLDAKRA